MVLTPTASTGRVLTARAVTPTDLTGTALTVAALTPTDMTGRDLTSTALTGTAETNGASIRTALISTALTASEETLKDTAVTDSASTASIVRALTGRGTGVTGITPPVWTGQEGEENTTPTILDSSGNDSTKPISNYSVVSSDTPCTTHGL